MKSSIRLDFVDLLGNGVQPVIRVAIPSDSEQISFDPEDPRDMLMKTLFEDGSGNLTSLRIHRQERHTSQCDRVLYLFRADREKIVDQWKNVGMTFGEALEYLKADKKIRRASWDKETYLTFHHSEIWMFMGEVGKAFVPNAEIFFDDWESL